MRLPISTRFAVLPYARLLTAPDMGLSKVICTLPTVRDITNIPDGTDSVVTIKMANAASRWFVALKGPCHRIAASRVSKPHSLRPGQQHRCRSISNHTHPYQASRISALLTNVDSSAPDFQENSRRMDELLGTLNDLHARIALGGPEKARNKQLSRGKMLVRE